MNLTKLYISVFYLLTIQCAYSIETAKFSALYNEGQTQSYLKIMSFNTYFLYDTEKDPSLSYEKVYTKEAYFKKLGALADVINAASPDVLALQEVENRNVLIDLSYYLQKKYNILHYESNDTFTGQDVALLYNKDVVREMSKMKSNLDYKVPLLGKDGEIIYPAKPLSKGILEAELIVRESGQRVVFLVTHLKSQNGGWLSDLKRFAQANTLRHKMEEVYHTKSKRVIVLGDLNDVNPTATLEHLTGEAQCVYDYDQSKLIVFHDVLVDYPVEKNFTYIFKKFKKSQGHSVYMGTFKSRLDVILASPWSNYEIKTKFIESVFDPSTRFPSDHLPVIAHMLIQKDQSLKLEKNKKSPVIEPIEPVDETKPQSVRIEIPKDKWELKL
ncbi:MAG: endonuclease/exonuclease/phosphatase family protein [Candidatus Cloacimonetes bacterium]|nr:endonuclease/exonuclease/phosphatase family protein [Candidatus Cloacimonadota bacterium]